MNERRSKMKEKLHEKAMETLQAVVPILLIVLTLCLPSRPWNRGFCWLFLWGSIADCGNDRVYFWRGSGHVAHRRKCGYLYDADQEIMAGAADIYPGIYCYHFRAGSSGAGGTGSFDSHMILELSVAFGWAFFWWRLSASVVWYTLAHMLIVLYLAVYVLAFFVPGDYVAVAFDSGGVTTGPMTVPFIMALGIGISAIRNDERAEDDSFGLVALSSVGPVLSVLVLGLIYHSESASYTARPFRRLPIPWRWDNSCGGAAQVYEGNRGIASADYSVFCGIPADFPENEKTNAD